MVQWLRLCTSTARGTAGSIPAPGIKILQAAWHSQKQLKKKKQKIIQELCLKKTLRCTWEKKKSEIQTIDVFNCCWNPVSLSTVEGSEQFFDSWSGNLVFPKSGLEYVSKCLLCILWPRTLSSRDYPKETISQIMKACENLIRTLF